MLKRCRFCGVPVVADERFCSPRCRLTVLGRSELAVKEDVTVDGFSEGENAWMMTNLQRG
jgi:hypothetical protein